MKINKPLDPRVSVGIIVAFTATVVYLMPRAEPPSNQAPIPLQANAITATASAPSAGDAAHTKGYGLGRAHGKAGHDMPTGDALAALAKLHCPYSVDSEIAFRQGFRAGFDQAK